MALVHLLLAVCGLGLLGLAGVMARMWIESWLGAQWAKTALDDWRSIDVSAVLARADRELAASRKFRLELARA